jgi:uracil-DNA glycosylase
MTVQAQIMPNDQIRMRTRSVNELLRAMKRIVTTYPSGANADGSEWGVKPIQAPFPCLKGTAFFSGGYGVWRDDPTIPAPSVPVEGTLFVGHNFDGTESEAKSGNCPNRIDEPDSDTWKGMLAILGNLELKITSERCFFTNALMGERIGEAAGSIRVGRGANGQRYLHQCEAFLRLQIRWARPRILVVLGAQTIERFRAISCDLHVVWRGCESLVKIDGASASIIQATVDRHRCTVVIIPHPAAWPNRKGYDVSADRILKLRAAFSHAAAYEGT